MRTDSSSRQAKANAGALLWQSKFRIGLAPLVAIVEMALAGSRAPTPLAGAIAAAVLGYMTLAGASALRVRQTKRAGPKLIVTLVFADIAFVLSIAAFIMTPAHYGRALFYWALVIVVADFYFGSFAAWVALGGILASFIWLGAIGLSRGAVLDVPLEAWTVGVFTAVALVYIGLYGGSRRRLERLAWLFERVEEGDFTETYDVQGDRRPDSITMVGRAYNRVHARLATMVLTDAMSGCLNRRGMEREIERELERAARYKHEVALLAVDVDKFKLINDTFGHLAGDNVIREMGEILRGLVRGGDVASRLGGDEFVLLLPETNTTVAFKMAMRIRDAVAAHKFEAVNRKVPITVSVGMVADRVPDSAIAHDLLSRADEALYAAKDAGRNRVSVWSPNLRSLAVARAREKVLA
ncbi:MAG: diguanylate cyclase [Gemmatimonadaceae bacterium]